MTIEKMEEIKQMFSREYDVLERNQAILEKESLTIEDLTSSLEEMVKYYNMLLKDSMKMTKIGDASQRKLVKANEKIENLNSKLQESEQNIKELNTILMHYIKATDR